MKKYVLIFMASFLVFFSALGGIYYYLDKTHDNMIDPEHKEFVVKNPEFTPPEVKNETVVNTLFMGVNDGLSDIMMVVRYNIENHKIAVVSVPRDTRVMLPSKSEGKYYEGKINAALSKDPAVAMKLVGDLLDIPIHHYITVNLKGSEKIVDILGGVEINVPQDMYYEDPTQDLLIDLKKGKQVLNGAKAVQFVRYREGYANQDLGRIEAQQAFMRAFIDKLTSPKILPNAFNLINTMSKNIKTNMGEGEIFKYAKSITNIKLDNISIKTVPGDARTINKVAYFIHNPEDLKAMMNELEVALAIGDRVASTAQSDATSIKTTPVSTINKQEIKVEILNSTKKAGLASNLKKELEALGYTVVKIGDTKDLAFITSRLIDRSGNEEKVLTIANDTDINIIDSDVDNSYGCDITIILGKDKEN